jgi:ribosome-associated protein
LIDSVKFAAKIADEKKADYIKILDVSSRLVITDYFIIIGAKNSKLTKRIEEEIGLNLKKHGLYAISVEGATEGDWILMDYDEFIIHIFTEEYRLYYDLERLWRDSKPVRFGVKKPAKDNDLENDLEKKTQEGQ